MSKVLVTESYLTDIGDALREKLGVSDTFTLPEIASQIADISGGGGGLFDIRVSAAETIYSLQNLTTELDLSTFTWMVLAGTEGDVDEGIYEGYDPDFPTGTTISAYAYANDSTIINAYYSNITHVANNAFQSCVNLNTASFPECVYIGSSAFADCVQLESVYLGGSSAVRIDSTAFDNTPITDSTYLGYYGSIYTPHYLKDEYSSTFYSNRICYYIPEQYYMSSTFVNGRYLYGDNSEYISNICFIGSSAFKDCSNLTTVTVKNCSIIYDYAFYNCTGITGLNYGGIPYYVKQFHTYAFANCTNLKTMSLREAIDIGDHAFESCVNLYQASLPKVETIGESAFADCHLLSEVYLLGSSVVSMYSTTFDDTAILNSSYYDGLYGSIYVNPYLTSDYVSLYSNLSSRIVAYYEIPQSQYMSDSSILSYENSSAIRIGSYAFADCSKLSSISFPNCKFIDYAAFQSCALLKNVYLPNVERLNGDAFRLTGISNCELPNLRYMGNAFAGCSSLKSLSLPMLKEINGLAAWNKYLSTISLPQLKKMPWYVLYNGTIQSIYLMGSQVVELTGTDDTVDGNAYSNYLPTISDCTIYVPSNLYSEYITDPVWMYCSSIIEGVNV